MGFAALKEIIGEGLPFNILLGIRVVELREGYVKLCVPFRPELVGDPRRPALHGGAFNSRGRERRLRRVDLVPP
jgi:acyl-coenzyme A thioesterase PaaI-like protein